MRSFLRKYYMVGLTFLVLHGASTWFALLVPRTYLCLVCISIIIAFILSYRRTGSLRLSWGIMGIFIIGAFCGYRTLEARINEILLFVGIGTVLFLSLDDRKKILYKINRLLTILISCSFVLFAVDGLLGGIPSLGQMTMAQYTFNNHLLYIDVLSYNGKFSAFSLEPGYYSLLAVGLICVNCFDFKKYTTILCLLTILFSFSLGGYVLFTMGLIIHAFVKSTSVWKVAKRVVGLLLGITVLYYVAVTWNGGNNLVNEKIVSRLEIDEDRGISGNNRENAIAQIILWDNLLSDNAWLGSGTESYMKYVSSIEGYDACSWLVFVFRYGLLFMIVYIFFFTFFCVKNMEDKKELWPFISIYLLDFIQHGLPFASLLILVLLYVGVNSPAAVDENRYKMLIKQ